jgi:hypothetical protein
VAHEHPAEAVLSLVDVDGHLALAPGREAEGARGGVRGIAAHRDRVPLVRDRVDRRQHDVAVRQLGDDQLVGAFPEELGDAGHPLPPMRPDPAGDGVNGSALEDVAGRDILGGPLRLALVRPGQAGNAILNASKSGLQRDPQRIEERSSTRRSTIRFFFYNCACVVTITASPAKNTYEELLTQAN